MQHPRSHHPRSAQPAPATLPFSRQQQVTADITGTLQEWLHDDERALARLMPDVVDELRRLARGYCLRESREHTLQATALVNEVYLRLSQGGAVELRDRGQFFAFAARLMREILIDYARARQTAKRGGEYQRVDWENALGIPASSVPDADTLIALGEVLDRLGQLDPRQRTIVELRTFAGLTLPEIAEVLEVSLTTVERGWRVARRWLARELA